MPSVVRRRLVGKQAPSAASVWQTMSKQSIASRALVSEQWSEVSALCEGKQRQHVHYTHVRTLDLADRQPESFTRAEFYGHLERCYAEAYPESANRSGSILLFGAVAKERHAAAEDGTRDEHHHAPTYCAKRHYWSKVAKLSYEKYRVKLNAVAHDNYYSMYRYITQPSAKKPLSELDQEVFLSQDHPRGESLRKLLEAGAVHANSMRGRKRNVGDKNDSGASMPKAKRIRLGDVYDFVVSHGVRTVLDLKALACKSASQGDTRLAEFCTAMGDEKLNQAIQNALGVLAAPQLQLVQGASRMELLRHAAINGPCRCQGVWVPGALRVLENNGENAAQFCKDVCRALEVGARRGTNVAVVGEPGCGKSMLFESFDGIFSVMGKPQRGSSFPLASAIDADVLLWQDWKHDDATVLFEDMLSFLVGERIDIRVPHQKNVSFRNTSPLFYTSNSFLQVTRRDAALAQRLNDAMAERFTTRVWTKPLPPIERVADFPQCAKCCANFYLMYR